MTAARRAFAFVLACGTMFLTGIAGIMSILLQIPEIIRWLMLWQIVFVFVLTIITMLLAVCDTYTCPQCMYDDGRDFTHCPQCGTNRHEAASLLDKNNALAEKICQLEKNVEKEHGLAESFRRISQECFGKIDVLRADAAVMQEDVIRSRKAMQQAVDTMMELDGVRTQMALIVEEMFDKDEKWAIDVVTDHGLMDKAKELLERACKARIARIDGKEPDREWGRIVEKPVPQKVDAMPKSRPKKDGIDQWSTVDKAKFTVGVCPYKSANYVPTDYEKR